VHGSEIEGFVDRWRARYQAAHPGPSAGAAFVATRPGPAAFVIDEGAPA
jgi:hypothetical protein